MFVSLLPAPPGYVSCSQLALEHSEKGEKVISGAN